MKSGLFSKVHYSAFINSECQMAVYHLVMKCDRFTPFCGKLCFFPETSFHHSLSPFIRSPMSNLGSTGSSIDVQETPAFSFPAKTHCLFLQLKRDPVYKEKHCMYFFYCIACTVPTSTLFPLNPRSCLRASCRCLAYHEASQVAQSAYF